MSKTKHFLLIFSPADGALEVREYASSRTAITAYNRAEERNRDAGDQYEIVLVGADSLETVKQTHGNYFRTKPGRMRNSSLFSEFLRTA